MVEHSVDEVDPASSEAICQSETLLANLNNDASSLPTTAAVQGSGHAARKSHTSLNVEVFRSINNGTRLSRCVAESSQERRHLKSTTALLLLLLLLLLMLLFLLLPSAVIRHHAINSLQRDTKVSKCTAVERGAKFTAATAICKSRKVKTRIYQLRARVHRKNRATHLSNIRTAHHIS